MKNSIDTPLTVAQFITPAGLYGAEHWVSTFLKYRTSGENYLVCSNLNDQSLANLVSKRGTKVFNLQLKNNLDIVSSISQLRSFLQKHEIDILHTHGYKSDIIGRFSTIGINTKIISTPHGWDLQSGWKVKMYDILDRIALKYFDRVVPLSKQLVASLSNIPPKKLILINNLVDLEGLPVPKQGNEKLITYIGRLTKLKRVDDIIRSMTLLCDDVILQIIGDGPERQNLEELVSQLSLSNRVVFLGYRKDRLEVLNNSGILVLASLSEGVSRTLMESMAIGKIVVGSDIDGNRNLIIDNKTGYLFESGNYRSLANILTKVIAKPEDAKIVSKNARNHIKNYFCANKIVKEYETIYNDLFKF